MVLHLVVSVVPDPVACMHEAARVLKVGGRLSIFDKFLPDHATPSFLSRLGGSIVNVLFFDLNRQLGPLLTPLPLQVQHHEHALLDGTYTITQAVKIADEEERCGTAQEASHRVGSEAEDPRDD
jgi:hypothetical protein